METEQRNSEAYVEKREKEARKRTVRKLGVGKGVERGAGGETARQTLGETRMHLRIRGSK